MRNLTYAAAGSSVLTTLALTSLGWAPQDHSPGVSKLENARVHVSQIDSSYPRIDFQTGAKEVRQRQSGDVIWHNKCDGAPVHTNLGTKPNRTLVIEVK